MIWREIMAFGYEFRTEHISDFCARNVEFLNDNLLKPTGHVTHQQFNIQQLYVVPTLCLCFVFIWEQTATCATYGKNWLVFITEMKSVYCAVRTGSLNKTVSASYLKG